jgi:hypothetical protein
MFQVGRRLHTAQATERTSRYWQTQEFCPDTYEDPDFAMQ